jgi:hypothetical protein
MKTLLVGIAFLMAACSQPTSAAVTPTPSASATPTAVISPTPPTQSSAYAVVIKNFLTDPGTTYTLSIVATDGHVAASTTAHKRTVPNVQVGNLSTSDTAVYYLDGDSDIRFLRPDGTTGLVTRITLGSKQAAAFSVSPDDLRIAVSVLDYTRYPVSTRLYVEDLRGGTNHIQLFYSASVIEWPVGWHAGRLVMALGIDSPPQNLFDGFKPATGYHVVNAQTGARLLSLCTNKVGYQPESPAGAVCIDLQAGSTTSWDGRSRALPFARKPDATSGVCSLFGPLSPTGVIATIIISRSQGGCSGGPDIFLISPSGVVDTRPVSSNTSPNGWIDSTDLVVHSSAYPTNSPNSVLSIVNVNTRASAQIQAEGSFVAVLPGSL